MQFGFFQTKSQTLSSWSVPVYPIKSSHRKNYLADLVDLIRLSLSSFRSKGLDLASFWIHISSTFLSPEAVMRSLWFQPEP